MGANPVVFIGVLVLPYVLIVAGLVFLLRTAYRSGSPVRALFLYPLICSATATTGFIIWGHYAIATSRSSTAAVGYIFLPFYSVAVAGAGFLVSWSVMYIVRFTVERLGIISKRITAIPLLIVAVLTLCTTALIARHRLVRQELLRAAASASTNPDRLEKILAGAFSSRDLPVLSLLAKNPSTPPADLIRIYDFSKHSVSEFNPPEYVVFHSLAQNPRTPPDILVVLAACPQMSIRVGVGMNPGTPTETLRKLSRDKENLVRSWMTSNPKIPKELLLQLANDPDQIVRNYAQSYLTYRGFDREARSP
jgi:hypothetical protein